MKPTKAVACLRLRWLFLTSAAMMVVLSRAATGSQGNLAMAFGTIFDLHVFPFKLNDVAAEP